MPPYIGKSVNIRSRTLAHLRTVDEATVLRQAKRISRICTTGEVGVLLLEAQLVKERQPLFDKRLRHNRQLYALQLINRTVQTVYTRDTDFSYASDLLGLFADRRAVLQVLQSLVNEQQLRYDLLGLKPLNRGYVCLRSALECYAGACCGKESHEAHHLRLLVTLEGVRVIC